MIEKLLYGCFAPPTDFCASRTHAKAKTYEIIFVTPWHKVGPKDVLVEVSVVNVVAAFPRPPIDACASKVHG